MAYADQPYFSNWLENELQDKNWSLQKLVVEMQNRKVSRSDDYLSELLKQELEPIPEDIEVLESVFEKLPGTLTHCSNNNEENLWYAFNAELPLFSNLPVSKDEAWRSILLYAARDRVTRDSSSTRFLVRTILSGLSPASDRQAVSSCGRCGDLVYSNTLVCRCGLRHDQAGN